MKFFIVSLITVILGCIGISVYQTIQQEPEYSKEGIEYIVSAQMTEVADDGVLSRVRKYKAKDITKHIKYGKDGILLNDVQDEFGNSFESVLIQNVPYIIETVKIK